MNQETLTKLEIIVGHQNFWTPKVLNIFPDSKRKQQNTPLTIIKELKPNLWGVHSVKFDWGYLGMMSFSYLNPEKGTLKTEMLSLPHTPEKQPDEETLTAIGNKLEAEIQKHIEEVLDEMSNVLDGGKPTMKITTTHIAIELIRQNFNKRGFCCN